MRIPNQSELIDSVRRNSILKENMPLVNKAIQEYYKVLANAQAIKPKAPMPKPKAQKTESEPKKSEPKKTIKKKTTKKGNK